MEQHPRVTDAGEVPIKAVGNVKVAGLTPAEAAAAIQNQLVAAHYMRHPIVLVTVEQFATQTVSVLGEIKAPVHFQSQRHGRSWMCLHSPVASHLSRTETS